MSYIPSSASPHRTPLPSPSSPYWQADGRNEQPSLRHEGFFLQKSPIGKISPSDLTLIKVKKKQKPLNYALEQYLKIVNLTPEELHKALPLVLHHSKIHIISTLLLNLRNKALKMNRMTEELKITLAYILQSACSHENPEVLECIASYCVLENPYFCQEGSLLHWAVIQEDYALCRFLVSQKGICPNQINQKGKPPLFFSVRNNNLEITRLLLDKGAKIDGIDNNGFTVLHWAAATASPNIVKLLIDHNADVQKVDQGGSTPFLLALFKKRFEIASLLIENGADVNQIDYLGSTALHSVVHSGDLEMANFLIDHGANVNYKNDKMMAPLHLATVQGRWEMAKTLLLKGAYLNAINGKGYTLLESALMLENRDMLQFLVDNKKELSFLAHTANMPFQYEDTSKTRTSLQLIEHALETPTDLNQWDKNGEAIVHHAVAHQNTHIIAFVLKEGADINRRDKNGNTPLHMAVEMENTKIISLLIQYGADIHITKQDEDSPLELAIKLGKEEIIELLEKSEKNPIL